MRLIEALEPRSAPERIFEETFGEFFADQSRLEAWMEEEPFSIAPGSSRDVTINFQAGEPTRIAFALGAGTQNGSAEAVIGEILLVEATGS
jgi:hypothetical protein